MRDLKPNCISQNSSDLKNLINNIENTLNSSFENVNKNHLFNIGSGKAASVETCKFLLNVTEIGNEAREKFIKECQDDPNRFVQRITQQKLCTFASDGKFYKLLQLEWSMIFCVVFCFLHCKTKSISSLEISTNSSPPCVMSCFANQIRIESSIRCTHPQV